jgi:DNA-binding transcriptional MocR family regulator
MLDRSPVPTLTEQVMDWVRGRIAGRALGPGARLPSIRKLAETQGVSKSTVVEAYDRLAAEGVITARPGSGFYVTAHARPLPLPEAGPQLDRAVDPLWVMRQSLEANGTALKPGCGWLPESWMPAEAIRRGLRAVARTEDMSLVAYGTPLGFAPLRLQIALRLAEHGLEVPPQQILLTDSATQALDLLCRYLLGPGDTVLVDDPCYLNFLNLARAHRARVVGVPMMPHGPDLEAFARVAAEHRPRLYVTNTALHNPTGGEPCADGGSPSPEAGRGARHHGRRGRHLRGFRA